MKALSTLGHLIKCMLLFVYCNEFCNLTFQSDIFYVTIIDTKRIVKSWNSKKKTIMFPSCIRNLDTLIGLIAANVGYSIYFCVYKLVHTF